MHAHSWEKLSRGTAAIAFTATLLASLTLPGTALCEPKKPAATTAAKTDNTLEILGIVSDDAEEQADALTEALRAEARQLPGVKVGKATQTLDVMTTANKCPQSPDPTCQQDIAKQLKTSQYIWGVLSKAPDQKVTIDLHHYVKDKADHLVRRTYPANLRDQNDQALREKARHFLVDLLELKIGFVRVAGQGKMASCSVQLDGESAGTLRDGSLVVQATPGQHTLSTQGCPTFSQQITVSASDEQVITLSEPGSGAVAPPREEKKPFFTGRKVVAASMAGVGLAAGVVGVIFATKYASAVSSGNDELQGFTNPLNASSPDAYCTGNARLADGSRGGRICDADKDARTFSTVSWIAGGAGAALLIGGVVLWVTDPKPQESGKQAQAPKLRLNPSVGATNGLWLSGTF